MNQTTKAPKKPVMVVLSDMSKGDIFSEISHYSYVGVDATRGHHFVHLESGENVYLTDNYTQHLLSSADQYNDEMLVGREDKYWTEKQINDAVKAGDYARAEAPRVGDLRLKGIRSIFEEIYNSEVMMLGFLKQDSKLSDKKLAEARNTQSAVAIAAIEAASKGKKGVAAAALEQIRLIQENPIMSIVPGEERILRGYKTQFTSRDGRYDCMDMDINEIRPVNINTLQWLVYKGTKYIVEK